MPPRFTYWTILLDGQPTAFRAHRREDLYPTLVQLRRTNQTVELKWFAGGKVWDSPEARDVARRAERVRKRERRGPDWRPGGQHTDPRAKFTRTRAQKRKAFARRRPRKPPQ